MNETVEPCEDFYEFACGMFETNYPYYSNENYNSWSTTISLKLKKTVKTFLSKENKKYELTAIHITRKFYQYVVNGTLTLDENIDEISGLKEAYYAYLRYVEVHGDGYEPRLPGSERYSHQLSKYCHYKENGKQLDNIMTGHSPDEVRVREVLSLSPEFAKAWSFLIGTTMNPKKKAHVRRVTLCPVARWSMGVNVDNAVTLTNCMNETVEPCEDFYEFACGMFETNYPYYSDENENSWFTTISLKLKKTVK
ncbi:membrane metallo-endopeptidase-like 1, partial [Aphis craccivora]